MNFGLINIYSTNKHPSQYISQTRRSSYDLMEQNKRQNKNVKQFSTIMNFSANIPSNIINTSLQSPQPQPQPQPVPEKKIPTMLWGKPTWYLFHTLAEKVNETNFLKIRSELLNIIYAICVNMPCPKCAEHAKKYLNGINFNSIQNKEDLKLLFFNFHNYVNGQKKIELFKYEDLIQYKNADLTNIINVFIFEYNRKSKNIRFLTDELHREQIVTRIRNWFFQNIQYFSS